MSKTDLYPNGSVFTIDIEGDKQGQARIPATHRDANHQSYDVAVIEFNDDGSFTDNTQLKDATDWIEAVRMHNANGAIVVTFIHGWHHGAIWKSPTDGDNHFQSFRLLLAALTLREAERYTATASGRRVVGIYIGWNGDPDNYPFKNTPILTHLTFNNRYDTAETIGQSKDLQNSIHQITLSTKGEKQSSGDGQLIFIGHSMGGLILESALLALLKDTTSELLMPLHHHQVKDNPVTIQIGPDQVIFPDAVISLNSAASSNISKEIKKILEQRNVVKKAEGMKVQYHPPLMLAVTSESDRDTGIVWSLAKLGGKTTGHDYSLFTHYVSEAPGTITNVPFNSIDFGQNFHCLRHPEPSNIATPIMVVDLPIRDRTDLTDWPPHRRYRLKPRIDMNKPESYWVFQVASGLIKNHNDIFNSRSASLLLALIQMSGAVASLAEDWERSFEE